MTKRPKSSPKTARAGKPASEKPANAKNHARKEPKETIAAEALVTVKKAEVAPKAPPRPEAKKAEAAPQAEPTAKKAEPAAQAPSRPAAKPSAKPDGKAKSKPPASSAGPGPAASPAPLQQRPAPAFAGAADTFERSFKEARQGTIEVNRKLIDFARANVNSSLDHVRDLAAARSPIRVMRLQIEYWHDCLEMLASQAQELRALSAELVARANEPIRQHIQSLPPRSAS